uniref:Uncharacterized protein n=1 Tax=Oryza brachyantha TaxID=4533 RepID=J3LU92_ORYBR
MGSNATSQKPKEERVQSPSRGMGHTALTRSNAVRQDGRTRRPLGFFQVGTVAVGGTGHSHRMEGTEGQMGHFHAGRPFVFGGTGRDHGAALTQQPNRVRTTQRKAKKVKQSVCACSLALRNSTVLRTGTAPTTRLTRWMFLWASPSLSLGILQNLC